MRSDNLARALSVASALSLLAPPCAPRPDDRGDGEPAAESRAAEGRAAINGTEIYFERQGTGEPILVLHGGPVLDHGYLQPWLAPLAQDHELVYADQRLSGRSAGTVAPESVRLAAFVEDVEQLRRELGLGKVHLLAHSWGGLLALLYAAEHPQEVRSLILVSPMAADAEVWRRQQQAVAERTDPDDRERMRELRESEEIAAGRPEAIEAMLRLSFKAQFHDPRRAAELELYVPSDYGERSRQFGALMPELTDYDLSDRLARIDAPVLLVYGAAEPGLELGGRRLREALPDARLEVVDDAGHFSFLERPEAFLAVVRDFLGGVDRASRGAA